MAASAAEATAPSDGRIVHLLDCPTDVLALLARALLDDVGEPAQGTLALARACCACRLLNHSLRREAIVAARARAAERWGVNARIDSLEQHAVLASLEGLGGTSVHFTDAGCQLSADRHNAWRISAFARLLRRHTTLEAHIEAHAGLSAPDRAAAGFSLRRASHVGALLLASLPSLPRASAAGADSCDATSEAHGGGADAASQRGASGGVLLSVACPRVGAASSRAVSEDEAASSSCGVANVASRLHMRGWGKCICRAAQWAAGPPSRRVDVFFTLGPAWLAHLPPRPDYYARVERLAAVARAAATPATAAANGEDSPRCVAKDRWFFDSVAQAIMQNPKLAHSFEMLHAQPHQRRRETVEALGTADDEVRRLFAALDECANESASWAKGRPAIEEAQAAAAAVDLGF